MNDCGCSEEFGPCELHGRVYVSREGASLRTADDLSALYVSDAVALGAELSPYGRELRRRVETALSLAERYGVRWLPDDSMGEGLRDELGSLVWQVEAELGGMGYRTDWDDGYRIARVIGGPLADDDDGPDPADREPSPDQERAWDARDDYNRGGHA